MPPRYFFSIRRGTVVCARDQPQGVHPKLGVRRNYVDVPFPNQHHHASSGGGGGISAGGKGGGSKGGGGDDHHHHSGCKGGGDDEHHHHSGGGGGGHDGKSHHGDQIRGVGQLRPSRMIAKPRVSPTLEAPYLCRTSAAAAAAADPASAVDGPTCAQMAGRPPAWDLHASLFQERARLHGGSFYDRDGAADRALRFDFGLTKLESMHVVPDHDVEPLKALLSEKYIMLVAVFKYFAARGESCLTGGADGACCSSSCGIIGASSTVTSLRVVAAECQRASPRRRSNRRRREMRRRDMKKRYEEEVRRRGTKERDEEERDERERERRRLVARETGMRRRISTSWEALSHCHIPNIYAARPSFDFAPPPSSFDSRGWRTAARCGACRRLPFPLRFETSVRFRDRPLARRGRVRERQTKDVHS